jgi:hypothetical protein
VAADDLHARAVDLLGRLRLVIFDWGAQIGTCALRREDEVTTAQ